MNKILDAIELGIYIIGWYGRANHPNPDLRFDNSHKILLEQYLQKIGISNAIVPIGDSESRKKFIEEVRLRLSFSDSNLMKAYNFGTVISLSYSEIDNYQEDLLALGNKLDLSEEWMSELFDKIKDSNNPGEEILKGIMDLRKNLAIKSNSNKHYDFFISHASEDKSEIVNELYDLMVKEGFKVWYDKFELKIGDSLRKSIDFGLSKFRYGIVIISPNFIKKNWTEYELNGMVAKEIDGEKVILPIWHNVTKQDVLDFSPSLADKLALNTTSYSLSEIVNNLKEL